MGRAARAVLRYAPLAVHERGPRRGRSERGVDLTAARGDSARRGDDPTRSEADSAAAFGVLTFGGHRRPRLVVWVTLTCVLRVFVSRSIPVW